MTEPGPRRPRREPGEQIVAAARRLLYESDDGFTIQQLVDEAGIALQTFYRYFASKDHLLLAVLERMIAESCEQYEKTASAIVDPVERLEFYVTTPLRLLGAYSISRACVITREHFRLHQLFPDEVARAGRPFTELVMAVILDGQRQSQLTPIDAERDAWIITRLVTTTYHHYAFADLVDVAAVNDHLWQFCRTALGLAVTGQALEPRRAVS